MSEVEAATTSGVRPDLTLILDVPSDVSLKRLSQRRSAEAADRFEKDGDEIFKARRQTFLDIAAREPDRCVVIAASGSVDEIGPGSRASFSIVSVTKSRACGASDSRALVDPRGHQILA